MTEKSKIIYHEPLPRILLIDFEKKDVEKLLKSNFNFKIAEVGYKYDLRYNIMKPKFHEIDLVFLYANYALEEKYTKYLISGNRQVNCDQFANFIINDNNRFFVVFVGSYAEKSVQRFFPDIGVYDYDFETNKTPHVFPEGLNQEPFFQFVKKNFQNTKKYYGIRAYPSTLQATPFLIDDVGNFYIVRLQKFVPDAAPIPYAIFLPTYNNIVDKVINILQKILPKMKPHLFPGIVDFEYLRKPEFLLPGIMELQKEINNIKKGYHAELKKKEQQIKEIEKEKKYLNDVLTKKDDELKDACGRVIQEILKMSGSDLQVLDIDSLDNMKDVDRRKKEDLRIDLRNKEVILIDVKGTNDCFGQGALNQLAEHRRIFQKYHKEYNIDDIYSLGILNHQPSVHPQNRDQIFGSHSKDALERIKADAFSIISTYDLFKLHKALSEKKSKATQSDTIKFLTSVGINKFDKFFEVSN